MSIYIHIHSRAQRLPEIYHWIILWDYITKSYYGIILLNDSMELYHEIIFLKRISRMPGTSREPPGILGIPCARPWDPRARPGISGDVPEVPQGRPWNPRGPPMTPYGRRKPQYLEKLTAPEALDCCGLEPFC